MDTFMDKLAQKLTAQEMIKANAAADAEEMKKLKSQVKEYHEILEQLQKVVADATTKIENAKVDGSQINHLVEEGIAKISEVQMDAQEINKMQEILKEFQHVLGEKVDSVNENNGHLELVLEQKFDNSGEKIHKECVKVYRNVQAVVVEESAKQSESVIAAVNGLKGKLGTIFGISIAALVVAIVSLIMQLLACLGVM